MDDQAAQRAVEVLAQQRDLGSPPPVTARATASRSTARGSTLSFTGAPITGARSPQFAIGTNRLTPALAGCADGELEAHRGDVRVIGDRPGHARRGPRARERADRNDETEDDATPHGGVR